MCMNKFFNKKQKTILKKEGEIITIKPDGIGSISHTFRVLNGRATLIESPYNNTLKNGLSFNSAAELDELDNLIGVLKKLREVMVEQLKNIK